MIVQLTIQRSHKVKSLTTIANLKTVHVRWDSFEGRAAQNPETPKPKKPFNEFVVIGMDDTISIL